MNNQIIKYRILFFTGWAALIFACIYAVMYQQYWLLLMSYVWARIITFVGVQIGMHRYFSHKSFETSAFKHKLLCFVSLLAGEGSPIAWSMHHRHHHKHSDQQLDLHSPHNDNFLSWQIKNIDWWVNTKKVQSFPKDLLRDSTIKFVDKNYYIIWILLVLFTLIIDWKVTVFFLLAVVGWASLHAILLNYTGHTKLPGSYRNFETNDLSWNNRWVSLFLGGEGLHNNHHQYPNQYNQAVIPGEFDSAAWVIDRLFK